MASQKDEQGAASQTRARRRAWLRPAKCATGVMSRSAAQHGRARHRLSPVWFRFPRVGGWRRGPTGGGAPGQSFSDSLGRRPPRAPWHGSGLPRARAGRRPRILAAWLLQQLRLAVAFRIATALACAGTPSRADRRRGGGQHSQVALLFGDGSWSCRMGAWGRGAKGVGARGVAQGHGV
jgi:hypothetical protein